MRNGVRPKSDTQPRTLPHLIPTHCSIPRRHSTWQSDLHLIGYRANQSLLLRVRYSFEELDYFFRDQCSFGCIGPAAGKRVSGDVEVQSIELGVLEDPWHAIEPVPEPSRHKIRYQKHSHRTVVRGEDGRCDVREIRISIVDSENHRRPL